ncbi:ubiquitin carboxyl-terminal hydrolase 44 [Lingula anatina]|uniref:Ubiquitin carboxyl-terminal hydrolase n=1 Tax=Lingula anatina TaxID=7574 RepID=A0A1S3JF16_LINAN|nr:ubiquitin carboxyl-terminal hydrolase 44 [Lingula anatina]XP_013409007.1 ubiquitin carboxyl-terminal hydrolase 44 [Lingula anatina]|eukprot:XP_013409004.1 ubiquitin carboxyl-terminal hydrolase 44 [Lingula anatina]
MDSCRHINRVKVSQDHSILNPQKWLCAECGTTESVWACLSCSHVACGRYIEEHAFKHYQQTKHPISIEVNERYVYCYVCDDYVLNDNPAGDLKLLRSTLNAVTTQSFEDVEKRGRRILRSKSFAGFENRAAAAKVNEVEDRNYTALWHRRVNLLSKVFYAWRSLVIKDVIKSEPKAQEASKSGPVQQGPSSSSSSSSSTSSLPPGVTTVTSPTRKKPPILLPGTTGLRNLGNTCYMNSILQVLSHLEGFRDYFLYLTGDFSPGNTPQRECRTPKHPNYMRQTTVECFQHINTPKKKSESDRGGLNGGSTEVAPSGTSKLQNQATDSNQRMVTRSEDLSLSEELHALFRVIWSGKWVLVSPHAVLHAVWNHIPSFKGFAQQDAQEFLCELLDKVQNELQASVSASSVRDVIAETFQGELISEVKCLACGQKSQRFEPFMDLSLDFPDRYHDPKCAEAQESCHITEMLAKFTETEKLDGEIYSCEYCNSKRRKTSNKTVIYTEAEKRFLVNKLPPVLRLHLKRFRWSGRNHREKIMTHVDFNDDLRMEPFCNPEQCLVNTYYTLSAVVIHHGRGFGSGHYTVYVWNDSTRAWFLGNDAKVEPCMMTDVLKAQAYILFYTQSASPSLSSKPEVLATPLDSTSEEEVDDEITFNFRANSPECTLPNKRSRTESESKYTVAKRKRTTSTSWCSRPPCKFAVMMSCWKRQ